MPERLAARAGPLLLLLCAQLCVSIGESPPWRCMPCSAEKISLCRPVSASCEEVVPAQGCSCCPTCALQLGAACGVKTARCALGLSCRALPGEPRPLLALTRGQGVCFPKTDSAESAHSTEAKDVKGSVESGNVFSMSKEVTQEEFLEKFHMMGSSSEEMPILWHAFKNIKALREGYKGPCQRKLYKVLNKLAKAQQDGDDIYKFYLPNCNKNGFYHIKQCETTLDGELGSCWCVFPWDGRKIPSIPKTEGDPKCHQYFSF